MMSGTMSASMVINNILVAASEFIIPDRMEQLKLILYHESLRLHVYKERRLDIANKK